MFHIVILLEEKEKHGKINIIKRTVIKDLFCFLCIAVFPYGSMEYFTKGNHLFYNIAVHEMEES